ncbi:MAG: hypothetical protein AAGA83_00380 [Cyanobacteria bacterium P01_F01_bin.116]
MVRRTYSTTQVIPTSGNSFTNSRYAGSSVTSPEWQDEFNAYRDMYDQLGQKQFDWSQQQMRDSFNYREREAQNQYAQDTAMQQSQQQHEANQAEAVDRRERAKEKSRAYLAMNAYKNL